MSRRIALIAVAVLLALIGSGGVYGYLKGADRRALQGTRSVSVLVAQKPVPTGTTWDSALHQGYLAPRSMPVADVAAGALHAGDSSVPAGEVAGADIAAGEVVLRTMFARTTATTGALHIPRGLQALTVLLPADADVAGFVQPGSQVAVYGTFKLGSTASSAAAPPPAAPRSPHSAPARVTTAAAVAAAAAAAPGSRDITGGTDRYTTMLLLPRVGVLAVSQAPPAATSGATTATGSSGSSSILVTLAVSQQQAERLVLSQQVGALYLAMLTDSSVSAEDGGVINVAALHPAPITVR